MIEFLGEEELDMVNFISDELMSQVTPEALLSELTTVFDDDTEDFVIKLWKMLIFFQLQGQMSEG